MTETSRNRVTITLGRSGQVVKRAASDTDHLDGLPGGGRKRSVRERLGSSSDGSFSNGNDTNYKRQRGDVMFSANAMDGNAWISKDDLRFKLMRKNASKQAQSNNENVTDLRQKLLRTGQPSSSDVGTHQHIPDPRGNAFLGRIPSSRSADDLLRADSSRSSYSRWTFDHSRRRSPDRIIGTSRGLSPPRNVDGLRGRPLSREFDDVRAVPYMHTHRFGAPRPMGSAPFTTGSMLPPATSRPPQHVTPKPPPPPAPGPPLLSRLPQPGVVAQKAPQVEEHQTIDSLLNSLGLGKYAILFKAEEVDMTVLKQMGENDLKELGIPMGPRKKIILALTPRGKRPT